MAKFYNMYTQDVIAAVCDEIKALLLEKNRKYGDSALNPIRVFSKSDTEEQIKVRIDDKLNRLRNLKPDDTEDTVTDLIGYLILLRVKQRMKGDAPIDNIETNPSINSSWSKI